MNENKRNFLLSTVLVILSIIFTVLVKLVDVGTCGETNTEVGFSHINQFVFDLTGVHMVWYHITDWLGLVPIAMCFVYAFIGLFQWIKRRHPLKVDREILALGGFYIVTLSVYIFFENIIINYRPVFINGFIEASYPSSHTVMALCLCISSIMVNKRLYKSKLSKAMNIISAVIVAVTVLGRLISGVHWFTDILGGIIISSALLTCYYSVISAETKR